MQPQPPPRPTEQDGSALLIALVAITILTITATIAVDRSVVDLARAGVAVESAQSRNEAANGLEHTRALYTRGRDVLDDFQAAARLPGRCVREWIGPGLHSADVSRPASATLGQVRHVGYDVSLCATTCAQAPVGNDLASGSNGRNFALTVALDAIATASTDRATAREGGLILADVTTTSPCR